MRQVTTYAAATLFSGLTAVASIPLLIRTLDAAGFGVWGIAEASILLGSQMLLAGTNFAIFEAARNAPDSAHGIAARWLPQLGKLYAVATPLMLGLMAVLKVDVVSLVLVWIGIGAEGLCMLAQAASRAAGGAGRFFGLTALRSSIWLGSLYILASSRESTLDLVLVARIMSSTLPGMSLIFQRNDEVEEALAFTDAVRYGTPIAAAAVLGAFSDLGERTIVASVSSLADAGLYLMASKYASILSMGLLAPLGLWWPRERARLRQLGAQGMQGFKRLQRLLPIALYLAATTFVLASDVVMPHMMARQEAPSRVVVAAVMYGVLLKGLMPLLGPGAMERGRTWIATVALSAIVILQMGLQLVFVPKYSIEGAAFATLFSAAVGALLYVGLASRFVYVPGSKRTLAALMLAIMASSTFMVVDGQ